MRKLILLFSLLAGALNAQIPSDLKAALDHTLDSMQTVLGNKSLSAAIAFPHYSWAHAKGVNSGFPATQVDPNDAYLIGSVTKPITAACILQLVDEGKLSLDDSLYQYVDTIPNINPNITIRQLLQHRTGIFDVLYNQALNQSFNLNPGKVWQAQELLEQFNQPPNAPPGGAWEYSNPNFWLLGMIIEKIEGKPFYEVYRERFFDPMGLSSFGIPAFETLTSPVAHVWIDLNGDGTADDAYTWYMGNKALNSAAGAAGGFFATATDLATWMRAYMRGDLVSPAMMTQAKTTVPAPGSQGNLYGLGLMKNTLGGSPCYGHGGDLAYSASAWYFPDCDVAVSVLNNDGTNVNGQPKFSSWKLLPVVTALHKVAKQWCSLVNIEESAAFSGTTLRAWPNPAQGSLQVAFEVETPGQSADLELVDLQGRVALQQHCEALNTGEMQQLDLPEKLAPGMYFLRVKQENRYSRPLKIVIEGDF